jgi:uncharacterized YigZ family protein
VEQEIKRSLFITTVEHVKNRQEANQFIKQIQEKYPDANHNCWAYIAGDPKNTIDLGMSDDGEPTGTAGKPMLNVLQHKGIGEIGVVITRYFGGTKLGTGGLVRAYSSSVQQAIAALPLNEFIAFEPAQIKLPYPLESLIRHILKTHNIKIKEVIYQERVVINVEIPSLKIEEINLQIKNQTQGKIEVCW